MTPQSAVRRRSLQNAVLRQLLCHEAIRSPGSTTRSGHAIADQTKAILESLDATLQFVPLISLAKEVFPDVSAAEESFLRLNAVGGYPVFGDGISELDKPENADQ
jgi:hypothetical protein